MLQLRDSLSAANRALRNGFVEMGMENELETREESIELAWVIDDIPLRMHIRYGQIRNRRLGNRSNRR